MEEFRAIPGYDGLYEVSNIGRVRSNKFGKIKDKSARLCGCYFSVNLYKNGRSKTFNIHQLVAMAFLNHVPDYFKIVVDHINRIKTDNRLENLRLVTTRENCYLRERELPIGVTRTKNRKKFKSRITINGKIKTLGTFFTPEEASEAYQKALKQIKSKI
jgi:hypothetical protein